MELFFTPLLHKWKKVCTFVARTRNGGLRVAAQLYAPLRTNHSVGKQTC